MQFIVNKIHPGRIALIYVTISTWLIVAAFFMQIFMHILPCELCLWQRIPHYVVMFGAVLVPLKFYRFTFIMQLLAYIANICLSGYHSGIERQYWKGLQGCSSPDINMLSIDALRDQILATQIIKCDEISWSLFGLSLTNYNFIICCILALTLGYFLKAYDRRP